MQCPKCGNEVPDTGRFCGSCGTALLSACPVCGHGNPQAQRFCEHCGSEVASATPGLLLDKALAWRDTFERMGWCEDPANAIPNDFGWREFRKDWLDNILPTCYSTLREHGIPEAHTRAEPWVFFSPLFSTKLLDTEWKIDNFEARVPGAEYVEGAGFLLATRCRLVFVQRKVNNPIAGNVEAKQFKVYRWLYRDINQAQVKENGDVRLWTEKGDSIYLHINTKGVRFIDRAIAASTAGSQRQGQYLVAASNIASANQAKMGFLEVIQEFCRDIIAVGPPPLH
ncbi:MAG: zinc ribbon domain-containing protein [Chloroflexi bacterium]|nr:zinc ribbon domain-containing protein [Chloroflexota bacterium]